MSHPFIIWTMQRTGGISLFTALSSVSEHPAAENEPFDYDGQRDRQFTDVGRRMPTYEQEKGLRGIVDSRWLIKHCYELFPDSFNLRLAEISTRAGYQHIHRYRENEVARLVSRGFAQRYGTWVNGAWNDTACKSLANCRRLTLDVPALRRYHEVCISRWSALQPLLRAFEISMEETLDHRRLTVLAGLACFLNIPQSKVPEISANMGRPNQASRLYGMISNRNELAAAIGATH